MIKSHFTFKRGQDKYMHIYIYKCTYSNMCVYDLVLLLAQMHWKKNDPWVYTYFKTVSN